MLHLTEKMFKKSVKAEYTFFESISAANASRFAPQLRDALILFYGQKDPAMAVSMSIETNPATLTKEWVKVLHDQEHNYEALVAVERDIVAGLVGTQPTSFVAAAKEEVRNQSRLASRSTRPMRGKTTFDLTESEEPQDEPSTQKTKSKPKYGSDSEEDVPLPDIDLTESNLENVAMLKKCGGEVSRVGNRAIDWVATTFGADPSDLSWVLKGSVP